MRVTFNFFENRRERCRKKKHRAVSGQMFFSPIGAIMPKFTMKADDNGARATLAFKDKKGNPAPVFGVPEWSLSADGIVDMTVDADGMGANFVPTDATGGLGTVTVNVKAEGDAVAGTDVINLTGDLEVIAADAATGEIAFTQLP